ncbi:MAG TPA: histidine phosphatase family protein [Thiobacillaceae bacterium]|nr:histidine phosphatase family protein [Thiobacillaceae bacterium]HNU64363.1 histidine phosphatase family protein [Thiobacillaceae bacterium]
MAIELPPQATRVTVLRHGAVQGRAHVLRGILEDPLSPEGEAAMTAVLARLDAPVVDAVLSSPQRRCLDFARAWARRRGVPLHVVADLRERAFGTWEGLSTVEVQALDPQHFRRFHLDGAAPPGGESLAELRRRVRAAWRECVAGAVGGHRLLITHAGVMRVLLMELLGLPARHAWRIALPPAAHFQVSLLAGEAPVLLSLNPCAA